MHQSRSREILNKWYAKGQEKSGQMKQLAENMGEQARERTEPGGYPQGGGMPGGNTPMPADKRHEAEGG
ncbi:hypothetical protein [Xenophilus azovorans]|uniref:hypothetical protein n=1 Tax=Xenophilus azovorans TaxID=151755 RepID=UPI0012EEAFF3|nr:hypothetical protein [Xenophilus azovorans]